MTARILVGDYSDNPCAIPWLSQSIALTLLTQSPLHAAYEHPMLGNSPRKPTDAMKDGLLLETVLLKGGSKIAVMEHDEYRTKIAKEDRDNAIAGGFLPVKRKDYDELMSALDQIKANVARTGVSLEGDHQVSVEWEEEGEYGPVVCRGRLDILRLAAGEILDVKKVVSAHPKDCARSMVDYGADIQTVAYTSWLEKFAPALAGRVRFQFVFIEKEPPYAVVAPPIGGMMREMGERRWQRAVKLWERCLLNNDWPGYERDPAPLEPTAWQLAEEMQ